MKLIDLAQDTTLVPSPLNEEERNMRSSFINIRVRILRAGSSDPTNIPDVDLPGLISKLSIEIIQAENAYNNIWIRVSADDSGGNLYDLRKIDKRIVRRYRHLGSPSDIRKRLVKTIVWWACANHDSLLNSSNIDNLHLIVDRRLHSVERMLYDIGAGGFRAWQAAAIYSNPGGDWIDGWNRMFEYPRVPKKAGSSSSMMKIFKQVCNPSSTPPFTCQNVAMDQWAEQSNRHINLLDTKSFSRTMSIRLNPSVRSYWVPDSQDPDDDNAFVLKPGSNPVDAIEKLFETRNSYKDRNLLFCDHTIHSLNMEALLWAKKKRSPDTSWLTNYVDSPEKLRIDIPFWKNGPQFLAGYNDGVYFESCNINSETLQVGDNLIIYNHPAYDKINPSDVWRLENAMVVMVYPSILYQGHGINPLTIGDMKREMLELFNKALNRLRTKVNNHIATPGYANEFEIDGGHKVVLRFESSASSYSQINQKADWWVRWVHDRDKDEPAISADPDRKALAWNQQKVDYDTTYGYFPLWEAKLKKKGETPELNSSGKIIHIKPVTVNADMIAAWTWYAPSSLQGRKNVPVIRPMI